MNQESQPLTIDNKLLDDWATNSTGPVALYLKQKLLPVGVIDGDDKDEQLEQRVIFPPTYADIGYNIDTFADGTRVATIDSVGSQANRLEPIFKTASQDREEWLVPQLEIVLRTEPCGECETCKKAAEAKQKAEAAEASTDEEKTEQVKKLKGEAEKSAKEAAKTCTNKRLTKCSVLDLAHRAADAVVRSSPGLLELAQSAFGFLRKGDAGLLCELAPTSLVFGVWDSRGESGEKRPRLVRSIIRAWNVEPLHAAAQFNSIWKELDKQQQDDLENAVKDKDKEGKLSTAGLADAPATFRKVSSSAAKHMLEFRDGSPNPDRRVLGGVIARGPIERQVTVNLVALRALRGKDDTETNAIRKYLLGLSLMAATADIELFLREGCLLRYADEK